MCLTLKGMDKSIAHREPQLILSDKELMARCQAGDRSAREDLARACLPRVRRTVVLTTGGGQDTDDLIQTAMVRIFAGLKSYSGKGGFVQWLDKVTVNSVRQYYRRRPFDDLYSFFEESFRSPTSEMRGPDRQTEGQRAIERLTAHLSYIRPKKRLALVLSAAYGYSVREMAEMMDCSLEASKKRLQHGRRELLARMHKDEYLCQVFKEIGQ